MGKFVIGRGVSQLDDTKNRIIFAAIKAVRKYGLEGARIQNISELAGLSPGALYRYFDGKDDLMVACFTYVDKQAATIFDHISLDPEEIARDPLGAVRKLWTPYFQFWIARPDETIFYHRFRDSAAFPAYDRVREAGYFRSFALMVHAFLEAFPSLRQMNMDLLWHHVLTVTILYAKYVVEGVLPNTDETEETIFRLMTTGLSGYLPAQ